MNTARAGDECPEVERLRAELLRQINNDTRQYTDISGWDEGKDYEDEIAAFEQAIRNERTPAWQGTPSIEEIEGHAKRYPLPGGNEGGYWLKPSGVEPEIVRLHVIDGRAVYYCEDTYMWQYFNGGGSQWLPVQPNGLPISSGCAACAEKEGEIERRKAAECELIAAYDATVESLRTENRILTNKSADAYRALEAAGIHWQGGHAPDGYYDRTLAEMIEELAARQAAAPQITGEPQDFTPTHRHYKGEQYQLLHYGSNESDLEPVAVYQNSNRVVWVRPLAEFKETFLDCKTGERKARFKPLVDALKEPRDADA